MAVLSRWSRCRGALVTSLETSCAEGLPGHGGSVPALLQAVSRLAARGSHLDHRGDRSHPGFVPDGRPIPVVEVPRSVSDEPRDPLCRRASGPRWFGSSSAAGGLEARRTRLAPRPSGEDVHPDGRGAEERQRRASRPLVLTGFRATGGSSNTSTIGMGLSLWSSQTTDAVPAMPGAGIRLWGRVGQAAVSSSRMVLR